MTDERFREIFEQVRSSKLVDDYRAGFTADVGCTGPLTPESIFGAIESCGDDISKEIGISEPQLKSWIEAGFARGVKGLM